MNSEQANQWIDAKVIELTAAIAKNPLGVTQVNTCEDAPRNGWSVEEYLYMPYVRDILHTRGFGGLVIVSHGVKEYKFFNNAKS